MTKNLYVLPYIEMYAGSTEPIVVSLVHENGKKYSYDEVTGYTGTLKAAPYRAVAGVVATPGTAAIQKNGVLGQDTEGNAIITFSFIQSDTLQLGGKYTYQVEVSHNSEKHYCQGNLFIKGYIS